MALDNPQSVEQIDVHALMAQDDAVVAAIQAAVDDAIEAHRREGRPIVVCDENGEVRWVPADEIEPRNPPSDR